MSKQSVDTPNNRQKIHKWFRINHTFYDNSTEASEACCCELDMYEPGDDFPIPQHIFEIALDYTYKGDLPSPFAK